MTLLAQQTWPHLPVVIGDTDEWVNEVDGTILHYTLWLGIVFSGISGNALLISLQEEYILTKKYNETQQC